MTASRVEPFEFGGETVKPGRRIRVEIPLSRLPTGTWVTLPVEVVHGRTPGPVIWLSGAVHGDELNGIAIVRRVLRSIDPKRLRGTVIACPIVNVFGVLHGSRYLPDRRDLNRSFPGSPRGSMAARLGHLFLENVVERCAYGIDLHTASSGRDNLPQIRANLDDPLTLELALAFGAPVMMHARERPGSLRAAGAELGKPVLLFEGGEALRFGSKAIAAGTRGVLNVMAALDMWESKAPRADRPTPVLVRRSSWARAGRSGLVELEVGLGDRVVEGQALARISDTFGAHELVVKSPHQGIVIGLSRKPLVSRGDALMHIAVPADSEPQTTE